MGHSCAYRSPLGHLRVSFVDDHPLLLEGTAAIFTDRGGFEVVALGSNVDDALSIARTRSPDVLCLDLNIPGDAIGAIRTLSQEQCATKVVVFTASESPEHMLAALNAGARGYVLKGSTADELASAMTSAQQGDIHITPGFAAKAIHALQLKSVAPRPTVSTQLSFREDQIVRMLLQGKKNREIALALRLSEKTVKTYMTAVMQKLNARSRLEVVIAVQQRPEILRSAMATTADTRTYQMA